MLLLGLHHRYYDQYYHTLHLFEVLYIECQGYLFVSGVQRVLSEEECGRSSSATVAICLSSDSRVLNSDLSSEWLQQFRNNVEMLAIAGV